MRLKISWWLKQWELDEYPSYILHHTDKSTSFTPQNAQYKVTQVTNAIAKGFFFKFNHGCQSSLIIITQCPSNDFKRYKLLQRISKYLFEDLVYCNKGFTKIFTPWLKTFYHSIKSLPKEVKICSDFGVLRQTKGRESTNNLTSFSLYLWTRNNCWRHFQTWVIIKLKRDLWLTIVVWEVEKVREAMW